MRILIAAIFLAAGAMSGPALAVDTPVAPAQSGDAGASAATAARRLLAVTNVAAVTARMFEQQITYIMGLMQERQPDLPDRVFVVLEEEFGAVGPKVVDEIVSYTAALYAERFTAGEMNAIADFYETEIGRKAMRELPALMAAGTEKGKEIGQRLGREAGARAAARIKAEGLEGGAGAGK